MHAIVIVLVVLVVLTTKTNAFIPLSSSSSSSSSLSSSLRGYHLNKQISSSRSSLLSSPLTPPPLPSSSSSSSSLLASNEINIASKLSSILKNAIWPVGILASMLLLFQQPAVASQVIDTAIDKTSTDGGLVQSFLLIFISEIGDKTFFIAGLLAAKYGRLISFTGSIGALAAMTIISTVLGQIFHAIPPSLTQGVPYDDIVAVAAFAYFGLKTLYDASQLEDNDNSGIEEEKEEAEKVVEELTKEQQRKSSIALIVQTFTLVFAAEIGDRSFLSTIALSAALNPTAVATGAIAAHASATGIAVAGGALLSKYLSEKVIGYIGGSLFLVFAVTTALGVF